MYVSAQIERERVQDRRDRYDDRHQHRRHRPEDEEEDDQRSDASDHRLRRTLGPSVAALRLVERVTPGEVHGRRPAVRSPAVSRGSRSVCVSAPNPAVRADRSSANIVCRSLETYASLRVENHEPTRKRGKSAADRGDRPLEPGALRHVALRREDGDVRSLRAGAERLQRALVRLVRRVAGDRNCSSQRLETAPAAYAPNSVSTTHAATIHRRRRMTTCASAVIATAPHPCAGSSVPPRLASASEDAPAPRPWHLRGRRSNGRSQAPGAGGGDGLHQGQGAVTRTLSPGGA